MADEIKNNDCPQKHLPKVRICNIEPGYRFEKKQVTLYDFDEEKVIEQECNELLEQRLRKVTKPQYFLRVSWCPKYTWVRKNVETTEKYWTKKEVKTDVARYCPKKVKKDYEVCEVVCDWKKVCKDIECKITHESEQPVDNGGCGCDQGAPIKPSRASSYSSRSSSSYSNASGAPALPF